MSKNPFLLTKNDILDAFNSIVNSDELKAIENLQSNLNLLSSRNANSNSLDALQGYGVTASSPSWNITHNIEPSSTPNSSSSCKPFSNLNLNSVEEEDEFLYGDSNSVPEEQLSVKEESIINTPGRHDTGWSDEEDPYGDLRPLSKLNSRLRKNLSECESQSKFQENVNFSQIKRDENRVHANTASREISAQKYASHKLQSGDSILSSGIEKNNFPEISCTSVGTKSKYHAAAEVLKKRTTEKSTIINSSSSEKLNIYPGTSKSSSEFDKSLHSELKTDKSAAKKPIPRTINKKHIDNIRDYIQGGPQRKRAHPHEDFPPEKLPRYETSRTSSFSPSRRHSPHRPSLPSHKPKSSYTSSENDQTRYASSYSRPRSPSFESEKHHHSRYSESHRRYSPSPKRWSRSPEYRHRRRSREKSTDYKRSKDKSPRSSRRSRSKSPGYYSSRNKTYDKKQQSKSPKKTDYYSKKKEKYSSGDSYCSLSLGSSSSSSSDSSDSSNEKRSSRKSPTKTVLKDNRKLEDDIANVKVSTDLHSKKPDSVFPTDDLSKKLSDIFNVKGNDGNTNLQLDSASINQLLSASLPNREQLLINFLEHQMQPQQQPIVVSNSSTYTSPSIAGLNIASNVQMMTSSDSYAYPSVPAAPVQYMAPQVPSYPPMMPSAAYPAPVMATNPPPTAEYGPYLTMPQVPANDSQYVSNVVTNTKSGKLSRPPATLRNIPVSENLHGSPTPSSNITVPTNFSLQNASTIPKIQESKTSLKSAKQSLETKNLKEKKDEKNISSSSKVAESTSEKNKVLIIDKFKRMKADRTNAQKKSKSATEDLDEMRKMLDETFGRKPSPSDKMLYSKCKNQFNMALDAASQYNKQARRLDENLNSFKARLPTALQTEVSKLKVEPNVEEPTNEIVSCLDQGEHVCCDCCISFNDIKEVLNHIQSPEHIEQMQANLQEWKKDFVKERKEDQNKDQKKTVLKPAKGAEFLKPLTGFYCALCKEVFIEEADAEQHLKGHKHFMNYDKFMKVSPLYERKRLFKQFINMAVVAKEKRLKAAEDKNKQLAEQLKNKQIADQLKIKQLAEQLKGQETSEKKKIQQAEQQKLQEAAEKKSKEILLKEKSREVKYEELEEDDSEDVYTSSSQKTANIKLNLSDKDKSVEKKNASKEPESKNSTKYVFIGKAPNFKKTQSQKPLSPKPTPWYKRENILNKKESDDVLSSPGLPYPFPTKKSLSPEVKPSNAVVKSKEELNSDSSLHHKEQVSRFDDSKIVKDKVNTPDSSSYKHVKLSEIKLPEVSSLPSCSNTNVPQPMDIDNSQAIQDKPRSEEEKDFLLLGIKREDFQPLVVPVPPPPTSMVSYPSVSNVQTFTSNISSSTTSTPIISNINLSVPPPTIAPYQNSAPPMPVYGNQNNTQNMGSYSYPASNPSVSVYSNSTQMNVQTNYQTMPQFSTPPPAFRNPPPMLPYSNTSNMAQCPSQFSNVNNLPPYNTFSNSMPPNLNNQAYQPPAFSMQPNNQTQFPAIKTPQNLAPPGSEYDKSFHTKNFKTVTVTPTRTAAPTQPSKVSSFSLKTQPSKVSASLKTQPSKVSPLLKSPPSKVSPLLKSPPSKVSLSSLKTQPSKVSPLLNTPPSKVSPSSLKTYGNLITIVPETKTSVQVSEFVSDNKPIKSVEIKHVNVQETSGTHASGDVNKGFKNVIEEKQIEKTNNTTTIKRNIIISKVVGIKNSSNTASKDNEKMNEQCLEKGEIKCIIDDKKTKLEICDVEENGKSSNVNTNTELKDKNDSFRDNTISKDTDELLKVNKQNSHLKPVPVSDSVESNHHKISNTEIKSKNDSKTILEKSIEIIANDSAVLKNEQKKSEHSDQHEISNIENVTSDSAVLKSEEKNSDHHEISNIKNKNDSKTTLEQNTEIVISDSAVLKSEQKNSDHEISNIENKNYSKTILDQSTENATSDSADLKNKQKISKISDHHKISNIESANKNDSEGANIKFCNKQISSEDIEINDTTVEKPSDDIFSVSGNSDKTDEEAEHTKSTEVTVTNTATEKIIERSILENKTTLQQSTENVTNDFAILKNEQKNANDADEISFEIFKVNIEMESGKLMDVADNSKKSSVDHCFLTENSSIEITEKCEDVEMPNLSTENSNSNINEKNENVEMPDLNTIIKEGNMSDLCSELSSDTIENKYSKNDSEETSMEICENLIPNVNMEVDEKIIFEKCSYNFYPLENISSNNDGAEVREKKEFTKTIGGITKIYESGIQENEVISNDSVSLEQEEINANYANESLCDGTSDINREKVCNKLMQENDNVASEKSIEGYFQEENSSCKIIEKSETVEMLNLNTMVGYENADDLCSDKNLQKDFENDILSGDITDILEGNSKTFLNTVVSASKIVDSTLTDISINKDETCELSMLKYKEGISTQDFKSDSCLAVKSNDNSQSSDATEKETNIEKILERNASVFISLEDITACNDKNVQETESSNLFVPSYLDANENTQMESAIEQDTLEIEDPSSKKEICKKSASKNQKRKPSKFLEPAAEESKRGRPLRSCRLRTKVIQDVNKEDDKPKDTHLKLDESHEDSELLEDEKKTQQSDSQAKKKKGRKQKGKKKKALIESATDVEEETDPVSESSNVCSSGIKESSDLKNMKMMMKL